MTGESFMQNMDLIGNDKLFSVNPSTDLSSIVSLSLLNDSINNPSNASK